MACCKHCKKVTDELRNDGVNDYCRGCYGKKATVRCAECSQFKFIQPKRKPGRSIPVRNGFLWATPMHSSNRLRFEIITSGVEHREEYYHRSCFTCAVCGKCLSGEQFLFRNGVRFCCACYEKAFSERCAKCFNTFTGMGDIFYIFYNNRPWHPECFMCNQCGISLLGKLTVTISSNIFCTSCASNVNQWQS